MASYELVIEVRNAAGVVEATLKGVDEAVFVGSTKLLVSKSGLDTPYTVGKNQLLFVRAVQKPVVHVGEAHRTCTFLVGFEGANFLSQCGELASKDDRCEEHQGK
jgi:hypothetical protein